MLRPAVAIPLLFVGTTTMAEISVLRCGFDGGFSVFITTYSDGTPARIGTGPGIGDRAHAVHDRRTGARVFVEVNTDDDPTTLTTVQPDLKAVHSRHLIGPNGEVALPSQQRGKCERITL